MKTVNLALMGFGNAARAFARILLEKEAMLAADYDACIRVTAIATGSRGALVDERGIDLREAIRQILENFFRAIRAPSNGHDRLREKNT